MGNHIIPLSADEQNGFTEFYKTYQNCILFCIRKLSSNPQEQEDLFQETLERLMRNFSTISELGEQKVRCYIELTLQSVLLDSIRGSADEVCLPFEDESIQAALEIDGHYALSDIHSDAYWDLDLLKGKLTRQEWLILYGRYGMGFTIEELAVQLGYRYSSMKTLVNKVRRKAYYILRSASDGSGGVQPLGAESDRQD